jgi:hypothetical protein
MLCGRAAGCVRHVRPGQDPAKLHSPVSGVLCDRYVCANDKGISRELTEKYLGKKAAANEVFTSSDVDLTEFTFANGIFCDVKERLCRRSLLWRQRSALRGGL